MANQHTTPDLGERFWSKVEFTDSCWLWRANRDRKGYGAFKCGTKMLRAHRFAYEWLNGPIAEGLTIDHLCRIHPCVNPDHLEPVTNTENQRRGYGASGVNYRKTQCPRGHPLSGSNLVINSRGRRECRTCNRVIGLAGYHRRREHRRALSSLQS